MSVVESEVGASLACGSELTAAFRFVVDAVLAALFAFLSRLLMARNSFVSSTWVSDRADICGWNRGVDDWT